MLFLLALLDYTGGRLPALALAAELVVGTVLLASLVATVLEFVLVRLGKEDRSSHGGLYTALSLAAILAPAVVLLITVATSEPQNAGRSRNDVWQVFDTTRVAPDSSRSR